MYALLYVYRWTDGQVLSIVKKIRQKFKKKALETSHVKLPPAGPKRPVTITV